MTHDIRRYGAVGDGRTLDTDSLQAAIRACDEAGGGTLHVPPGRYLTGPLRLCSNLDLHLAPGAQLLFSDDFMTPTGASVSSRDADAAAWSRTSSSTISS